MTACADHDRGKNTRERAWNLYRDGFRIEAIAAHLGIKKKTCSVYISDHRRHLGITGYKKGFYLHPEKAGRNKTIRRKRIPYAGAE